MSFEGGRGVGRDVSFLGLEILHRLGDCNSRVKMIGRMFRCNKGAFENVFGLENKRAN